MPPGRIPDHTIHTRISEGPTRSDLMRRILPILLLLAFSCTQTFAQSALDSLLNHRGDDTTSLSDYVLPDYASGPTEGAVSLRLGARGAILTTDVFVYTVGDTLLLPFTNFCDDLRMLSSISANGDTLRAEIPTGTPFTLIRSSHKLTIADIHDTTFDDVDVRTIDTTVYVSSRLFAAAAGLILNYQSSDLTLQIPTDSRIPAVMLYYADQRRKELGQLDSSGHRSPVIRQALGALNADWRVGSSVQYAIDQAASTGAWSHTPMPVSADGSLRLYGPFAWGELQTMFDGRLDQVGESGYKLDGGLGNMNWTYSIPGSPIMSQFILGLTASAGGLDYNVLVTNRQTDEFTRRGLGMTTIDGYTTPNWTVELYNGSELADVVKADSTGYYSFDIPLAYGDRAWWTSEVGPHAERIDTRIREIVRNTMLPPGAFDYQVSAYADRLSPSTRLTGGAVTSLGLTKWLTLQTTTGASINRLDSFSTKDYSPIVTANMLVGLHDYFETSYDIAQRLVTEHYWPSSETGLTGSYSLGSQTIGAGISVFTTGLNLGFNGSYGMLSDSSTANLYAEVQLNPVSLGVNAGLMGDGTGRRLAMMPAVRLDLPWFSLSARTGIESQLAGNWAPQTSALVKSDLSLWCNLTDRTVALESRAQYDHSQNIWSDLYAGARVRFSRYLWLRAGYEIQNEQWSDGSANISLTSQFALPFSTVQTRTGYVEGTASQSVNAYGKVMLNQTGLRFVDQSSAITSGVVMRAFEDDNGNGEKDGDERLLGYSNVKVESRLSSNDHAGDYIPVRPNESYTFTLDKWQFAGDNLYPGKVKYELLPLNDAVYTIDVPYVQGLDVSGQCELRRVNGDIATETNVFNYLPVRLKSTNGAYEFDGEVMDGGYLAVYGVSKGEYEVVFPADELKTRQIQLSADSPTTVTIDKDNPNLPVFIFEPLQPIN